MTTTREPSPTVTAPALHPLEPLSAAEIERAVAIVRQEKGVGDTYRFPCVTLREPPKAFMLSYQPGDAFEREAFLILLDNATGNTYEAIASLTQNTVTSWQHIPNVQPNIMADELSECEAVVKQHPDFLAALEKRGITDLDLVVVDPWAPGHFGFADEEGIRVSRCICYLRANPEGNFYSRPIDGLIPMVDLNKMEVIRIEDLGVVPVPPDPGEYEGQFIPNQRTDIKPLHITQPDGPSFQVEGHHIRWQKWDLRIGFNPREGLVLYQVGYEDQGRLLGHPWRKWWCPMATPAPSITARMPSTLANMELGCWRTPLPWVAIV